MAAATERGLAFGELGGFQAVAGQGISAQVDSREVLVGNLRMMRAMGVNLHGLEQDVLRLQGEAKTAMVTAVNGEVAGIIAVADAIKDGSVEAIAELHRLGLEVIMLTGDNQKTADAIGQAVGVDRVIAEVLPADKANVIKKLQAEGKVGPWWAMVSTMHQPWRRQMWVSPLAPGRMLPWRQRLLPLLVATCVACRMPSLYHGLPCVQLNRIYSGHSFTTLS